MATAGYSGTPLPKKLGLKDGGQLVLLGAPPHAKSLLSPMPPLARVVTAQKADTALALLFVADHTTLEKKFAATTTKMADDGALWIAWPKKSSPLFKDLTEDGIRDMVLPTGWVDVKVCAIDNDWSGLKLVQRRELRATKK